MALRLFNSRTRTLETFEPMAPGRVGIYVCGLTPSASPHVGHIRTFVTFDVLRRYLQRAGYDVDYVQNITDIDDRIIERSHAEGIPWNAVVTKYFGEYERCAARLNIMTPTHQPRATEEMPAIVDSIATIMAQGAAYETGDGVYFSIDAFPRYGRLSNRQIDELRAGQRVEVNEEKREPLDFALWKKQKPGEPAWPSPWGAGRPGWHIECSAMSRRYLGDTFDIHGGGMDLIFPHHENEVAQTETLTGHPPMARFWVHGGLLLVNGQKMSKSLGNFVPLEQMLERFPPAAIRYLFLQTGYRKPSNFTEDAIGGAIKGMRGLYGDLEALRAQAASRPQRADGPPAAPEFDAFIDDDLNTAGALGWLQKRAGEERAVAAKGFGSPAAAVALIEKCLEVFGLPGSAEAAGVHDAPRPLKLDRDQRRALVGIVADGKASEAIAAASLDDASLVERVVARRSQARGLKNWAESDRLRDVLARAGINVKDSAAGTEWTVAGR